MNTEELNSGDADSRSKPKRRRWRRWFLVVVAVLVALRLTVLTNRRLPLEIGPDTTVITGPLNADGTVNYVAYLNEQNAKGVTPETNAAAEMIRVVGVVRGLDLAGRTHQLMGLEPNNPDEDPLFSLIFWLLSDLDVEDKEFDEETDYWPARQGPWRPAEFPIAHRYLQSIAKALDTTVAAMDRPRWYWPLVADDDPSRLLASDMTPCQSLREVANALVTRAMLRAGTGDLEGCMNDLIAVHRLAAFLASVETELLRLVAGSMDECACQAEFALLGHRKFTAAQVRSYLGRLEAMAPWPGIARIYDVRERFEILDMAMLSRRLGFADALQVEEGYEKWLISTPMYDNMILRSTNLAIDRYVSALEITDLRRRQEAFAQLDREYRALIDRLIPIPIIPLTFARLIGRPGQGRLSEYMADMQSLFVHMYLSSTRRMYELELHRRISESIVRCGLRLELYRSEQGRFPDAAAAAGAIMPDGKLPDDPFDGALIYRRQGDGYILYSRGENEIDDGGVEDHDNDQDDIVLRVGAPTTQPAGTPASGDE